MLTDSIYKASKNLGIYKELCLLLDYIEADEDLNELDFLLNQFRAYGLTYKQLKQAVQLIEKYLPTHLGCDKKGCYLTQDIEGITAYTYIDDIDVNASEVTVNNDLLVLTR